MGSSDDGHRSLDSILNRSTPFAPANADEVRSRIQAAQASTQNSDEPGASGERGHVATDPQRTEPPELPPRTRVDFSDSRKLISEDRKVAGLSAASALARIRAEQGDRLRQERQSRTFSGTSGDGGVTASVDGTGRLLALDIDDSLLRGPDSRSTGRRIVDAVTAATAESIKASSSPDWSSF